jgi:hypothetical protein
LTIVARRWDSPAAMARPPSAFHPLVARLACAASLSALALAPAACEDEAPAAKSPTTVVDPAEQAKIDQGVKLIKAANDALNDKKYDDARKLLGKALALGVDSQRFEIEEATEKVDKRQAKLWANEVDEAFKNKDCTGAFKELAEPLKTLAESEAFTRELRHLVGADALKCVQDAVDKKMQGFAFADARKLADADETKIVLGPTAQKKLAAEVETIILEALRGQIEGDLKARRWAQAAEKIDAAAKKGDATEEQVQALYGALREGLGPEIGAIAVRSAGQRDAPAALKQVDALVKLGRWEIADPGVAALDPTRALPEEIAKKREVLAVWVEAERVKMRKVAKFEVRFTHGKVPVSPPAKVDAASKRDIAHGSKVWIVGVAGDRALLTLVDPAGAPLVQVLGNVVGWAATDRLAKEDTANWLPPDDQLAGERVWGPLRPPDGAYELGLVTAVNGKDITVQRLADGIPLKMVRAKLRSGRLSPGTRVLTFCTAQGQPAQIVEVPPGGKAAKLKCDGGQEKDEDLASLRSKPELLPTTK